MKTNLLLLDSLQNMEKLISSAFSVSDELKRKLKITYIFDFRWIGSGEFASTAAPAMDATLINVEKEIRQDFENAEKKIREITTHYIERNPFHVPYEFEVAEVSRLDYVDQFLKEEEDTLLLLSNYNSYTEFTAGAVNYPNIIDKVACPVLILPDDQVGVNFKNIVYASALHQEDFEAIRHLSGLFADAKERNLTVFHNDESPDFEDSLKWKGFQSTIKESFNSFNYEFKLSKEKEVKDGLEKAVKRIKPDLIVLLKEKKGFFQEVFSSSETRNVITHIDKPVLVYHEKNLTK